MKILRYIFFIPACLVVISLIYWLFGLLLTWLIGLNTFWLVVVLVLFGGLIWGVFKTISSLIMGFTSQISPNFEFAFWTITILSILNGIWAIYLSWSMDVNYSGKVIFGAIVFTFLIIELTFALIFGSSSMKDNYYE